MVSMVRLGFPKDIEDMSFSELLTAYLFLEKNSSSTSDDKTLILNLMANESSSYDEGGWVMILNGKVYSPYLKQIALELVKLSAQNRYCQTSYNEWGALSRHLDIDDPLRNEVVRALQGYNKYF